MKKNLFLLTIPILFGLAILFGAFSGENSDYPGGAPAGYTGSPGDGQNCFNCHGGSASSVTGWITSDIPVTGYVPGANYTITVTVSGSGNKGFEVSPQNLTGTLLGTLTPGADNKLTGSGKYVTHSSASSSNPKIWTFTWTAPAAGTGQVTFYGAFAVSKPVTKLSTLVVEESTAIPLSVLASATPGTICAGQSSQLNATASGGSGAYTYSWTSVPAGFTSTQQNPVVQPAVTTQYNVQVSDGSQTASAGANVAVVNGPTSAAGMDTTVCVDVIEVPILGYASNYTTVNWTTSGDGTFSNPGALQTAYIPGANDRTSAFTLLTLSVQPLSPCATPSTDNKTIFYTVCTGISNVNQSERQLIIYPNPAHHLVNVTLVGKAGENSRVTILDMKGNMMMNRALTTGDNSLITLDVSALAKGVYIIKVQTPDRQLTRKLTVE